MQVLPIGPILESKYFALLLVVLLNVGGSYIAKDIQNVLSYIFSNFWMKLIVLFALCFTSTRDVRVSVIGTLIFGFLLLFLLNTNSDFCAIPYMCQKNIETFENNEKDVKIL